MDRTLEMLSPLGVRFPGIGDSKKLRIPDAGGSLEALSVRAADVPTYVANGAADVGIVGKDVLWENVECEDDLYELLDLGFGMCRLVIASPGGARPAGAVWRVATKYPNCARLAFQRMARPIEIIKLYGSVELAPLTGIADVIVDIVETGRTLEANSLKVIEELGVSTARLIANRAAYKQRSIAVRAFTDQCRAAVKNGALAQ